MWWLIDIISFVGPIILLITSIYLLWKKETLLFYFVIGGAINIAINFILKYIFKEARPAGNQQIIQLAINNGKRLGSQVYGMPSGHAQTAFYCLAFILLSLHNWKITVFYILLSLLTCYQRYVYKEHTLWQIVIGALVGLFIGCICFKSAEKKNMGKLISKPDDMAPY